MSWIEMKCRLGGGAGGRRASPMTRGSPILRGLPWGGDEQRLIGFVDLHELHLDALGARGRKVLADVVGPDRELAMATVDENGQLDPVGTPVVEERLDRGPDRAARVEDVVDEHDR